MKDFDIEKIFFYKMTAVRTYTIFPNRAFVYALIGRSTSWADQLLPQLSMNNLLLCLYNVDTLNICMKEFGPEQIIFDKMTAVRTFFPNKAFVYA